MSKTNTKPSEAPLDVAIEGDQLVIRFGIDVLAFVSENCPRFHDYEKHGNYDTHVKVVDKLELAKDVRLQLLHEQEDGTTPLHIVFDDAIEAAFENGSLAFSDSDEP